MNIVKKTLLITLCLSAINQMQSGVGTVVQGFAGSVLLYVQGFSIVTGALNKQLAPKCISYTLLPTAAAIAAGARADSTTFDFPLTIIGGAIGLAFAHDARLQGPAYWAAAYAGAAVGELINMLCQDQPDIAASAGRVAILPTLGIASVLAGNKLGINSKY